MLLCLLYRPRAAFSSPIYFVLAIKRGFVQHGFHCFFTHSPNRPSSMSPGRVRASDESDEKDALLPEPIGLDWTLNGSSETDRWLILLEYIPCDSQ
jgi:hypothetical protein